MDPIALLRFAGGLALDLLRLLLDPKVWLLIAVAGLAGFVKGCQDEKQRFDQFKTQVEALGEQQEKHSREVNDRNVRAQQEVEDANEVELAALHLDLDALNKRLRRNIGGGFVPRPSASTEVAVPEVEREFLHRVYFGGIVCYEREQLAERIRESVERFYRRSTQLAGPAIDALDDRKWWGEWSRRVGACAAGALND